MYICASFHVYFSQMLVDYQAGQLFELLNVTNAVSFASTTASDAQVATATGTHLYFFLIMIFNPYKGVLMSFYQQG